MHKENVPQKWTAVPQQKEKVLSSSIAFQEYWKNESFSENE
jgi:hypothetical protein